MKGITTQEGRETLNKFKMEAANEVGVNLKQGYNGDLTAREVGSVGGQMVKKMIDAYKTTGNKSFLPKVLKTPPWHFAVAELFMPNLILFFQKEMFHNNNNLQIVYISKTLY